MVDFKDEPEEVASIINSHLNSIQSMVKRCITSIEVPDSPRHLYEVQDSHILAIHTSGAIKVFDSSLTEQSSYTPELSGKLVSLVYMDDGKIAVCDTSKRISILESLTGEVLSQIEKEPTEFMGFLPRQMNLITIGNTTLSVWDIKLNHLKSTTAYSGRATAFYLSEVQNICIIADSTNRISMYTPSKHFEMKGSFLSSNPVMMLAYVSKSNLLIGAEEKTNTLTVWRTDTFSITKKVVLNCGFLNCLTTTKDGKHLIAGVFSPKYNGTIMLISTRTFETDGVLNTDKMAKSLISSNDALYYTEDKLINRVELNEDKKELTELIDSKQNVTCIAYNYKYDFFFYAAGKTLFAYRESTVIEVVEAECNILCIDTLKNLLFISGEDKNIKKFIVQPDRIDPDPTVLWGHKSDVKMLKIGTKRKHLVSVDAELDMFIWNLDKAPEKVEMKATAHDIPMHLTRLNFLVQAKEDEICIFHISHPEIESKMSGYAKSLTHMTLNVTEKMILTYGDNGYVDIWKVKYDKDDYTAKFSLVAALNTLENAKIGISISIVGLILSKKEDCFKIIRKKGTIQLWSISDLVCLAQTKIDKKLELAVAKQHGLFCVTMKTEIYEVRMDFLNQDSLMAVGPHQYSIFYLKFLSDYIENPEVTTIADRFNLWVVLPWKLNILHLFAIKNDTESLSKAMRSGCSFITTEDKITPLTIALTEGNKEMTNRIIKRLSKSKDRFALIRIENELPHLNNISIPSMPSLYANAFMASEQPDLEQFGIPFTEPTHSVTSKSMFIVNEAFLKKPKQETEGKYLLYEISRFKLDLGLGNKQCRKFLTSLANCEVNDIFRAPIIHEIIQHKWKQVRLMLILQFIFYFLLTGLFVLHSFNPPIENWILLAAIFVINFFFYLYECLQLRFAPKKYLKDIWNWLDFPRVVLTFVYCHYAWNGRTEISNYILVTVLFLVFARGISFFRVFKVTRVFIRIIVEVAIDIIPFAGVVFFATVGFAILSLSMKDPKGELHFFQSLSHIYLLDFGEFDTNDYSTTDWVVYSFAMIVNPLIMFNLLIAIMSSTFNRVEQEIEVANYKEMALLILEMELIFTRNKSDSKKFIQICTFEEKRNFKTSSEWVGRFKTLAKSIKRLDGKIFELDKESKEMRDSLKEDLNRYFEASTAGIGGASQLQNNLKIKAGDAIEEISRTSVRSLRL